jgi:hypothetical protein
MEIKRKMSRKFLMIGKILFTLIAFIGIDTASSQQTAAGLPSQLYRQRREKLAQTLGDSSMMVLFSAPVRMGEWDLEYEYHQDSDFL